MCIHTYVFMYVCTVRKTKVVIFKIKRITSSEDFSLPRIELIIAALRLLHSATEFIQCIYVFSPKVFISFSSELSLFCCTADDGRNAGDTSPLTEFKRVLFYFLVFHESRVRRAWLFYCHR